MAYEDLTSFLQQVGKDPSRLIFEDELTGIYNRRFLHNYFEYKVPWDELEESPLSLLMLDVDHFKQVNDRYGHDIGDRALVWVADLLREVAGENGLAIRYGGDEFMLLMPRSDNGVAVQVGERLVERVRGEPLRVDEKTTVPITLSLGVATAPDDAQTGQDLIHKADTALYAAKKSGRDGLANARGMDLQKVSDKAALRLLEEAKMPGRESQLVQVAQAFTRFSEGQNQFLIVRGSAGMGRSMFLDAISRNLTQSQVCLVKVDGALQEMFHPYALTTHILVALLGQRADGGAEILDSLSREEIGYLAKILPRLGEADDATPEGDERVLRQKLLTTLLDLIPRLVGSRPLVLLIDDLQFADEATLVLLRHLLLQGEPPLFLCATSLDTAGLTVEGEAVPLVQFYATGCEGLSIETIDLAALTAADIATHLRGVFPGAKLPDRFAEDLAEITQGNALFLNEILRKLVLDQKVAMVDGQWVIEPLEEGYLPRSLEEIVSQKIAALDEESRELLARVSVFGETVSLSCLTGGSQAQEGRILASLDHAAAQGLLRSDFQLNDETVRFLGKRVQEIAYGSIPEAERRELHARVGQYQEDLYRQRLLPSAAPLAYHFRRSADQERAGRYARLEAGYARGAFNAQEALSHVVGRLAEAGPPDVPLDPANLAQIPTVIRLFLTAVRSITLYPPESKAIVNVTLQLQETVNKILAGNERLNLAQSRGALFVNGQAVDATQFRSVAETFVNSLGRIELEGVAFHRGFTEHELKVVLAALSRVSRKVIDQRFWQRFASEQGLRHIRLKQVRYIERIDPMGVSALLRAGEQALEAEDLPGLQEITRCLLSAARNIKLFPLQAKAVSRPIEQLTEAVRHALARRPVLTLARVGDSLLVNGQTVDTSPFKAVADSFLELLQSIGLSSVTFVEGTSAQELETFVGALGQLPAGGSDGKFWKRFAREQGLSHILFDQRLYEIRGVRAARGVWTAPPAEGASEAEDVGEPEGMPAPEGAALVAAEAALAEPGAPDPFAHLLETVPARISALSLEGPIQQIRAMIRALFEGFQGRDVGTRLKIVEICAGSLDRLPMGSQPRFAEVATEPLLTAFSEETDPQVFEALATLLYRMAANLILFAEYPLASRILFHLRSRQRQLQEAKDALAPVLAEVLDQRAAPATLGLLVEDLKSGEPNRQRRAAQLLSSFGHAARPVLVDLIKQVEELRVRQLAASLLAELGPAAAEALKRELVVEVGARERIRILEVIDIVTRDLKAEFAHAVGDANPQVRQAAFRLAERLRDQALMDLILDYARGPDTEVATAAIRSLGRLKPAGAVGEVVSVLNSTTDAERVVACCRALGLLGDPAGIEPLGKIVAPRGMFVRKRWSTQVRAIAAFALGQIPDPGVAEALAPVVDDPDPRIREIARAHVRAP